MIKYPYTDETVWRRHINETYFLKTHVEDNKLNVFFVKHEVVAMWNKQTKSGWVRR